MFFLSAASALLSLLPIAATLPAMATRQIDGITVGAAIESAYLTYLMSRDVATPGFYVLPSGAQSEVCVDDVYAMETNAAIFSADRFPNSYSSTFDLSFSSMYIDFLNECTRENLSSTEVTIQLGLLNSNTSHPGTNMQISTHGPLVPSYTMPILKPTIGEWQLAAPGWQLTWRSAGRSNSSIQLAQSAVSQNSSKIDLLGMQTLSAEISFARIELIAIHLGAWFDNFTLARELAKVDGRTAVSEAEGMSAALFSKFFGTAQNPAPAALYNAQALVVYKPEAVLMFASQAEYDTAKSLATKSGGMWQGARSNSTVSPNDANLELTITQSSQNAYIVGFVKGNYWDSNSTQSSS
ncbi:hypothetical protein FB451DRAFT_200113 [Mycena latifolia]|nr:hypothetical protein FB451DRAFT_200113 [Mycena latifolia]